MGVIKATDLNPLNTSIYSCGTKSKQVSSLPSSLQTVNGNNVTVNSKIDNITIDNIKNAINILEQKFSKNCCQANCNFTTTACQYYITKTVTKTSYSGNCGDSCGGGSGTYYDNSEGSA